MAMTNIGPHSIFELDGGAVARGSVTELCSFCGSPSGTQLKCPNAFHHSWQTKKEGLSMCADLDALERSRRSMEESHDRMKQKEKIALNGTFGISCEKQESETMAYLPAVYNGSLLRRFYDKIVRPLTGLNKPTKQVKRKSEKEPDWFKNRNCTMAEFKEKHGK